MGGGPGRGAHACVCSGQAWHRAHDVSGRRPPSPLPTEPGESVSLAVAGGWQQALGEAETARCKPQAHSFLALCPWAGHPSLRGPSGVAVAESCPEAHTS